MSTTKNAQIFSVTVMLMERVKPARSLQVRCMYALVQAPIIRRSAA